MADATLTNLFPALPLRVGGERLSVRPVVFRELPLVDLAMRGWGALVVSGGVEVPTDAWDAFLDLLTGASGRSRAWVTSLPEEEFEKLASFALAINAELWDPDKGGGAEGDDLTWASITQRLITFGHSWESLQELTLSQLRAFLEESIRQEREQLARDITAASFSMADTNSVQKATRELRRV